MQSESLARIICPEEACREFIEKNLNDPSSSQFEKNNDASANINGTYLAQVSYRAKNAFGATIKDDAICTMRRIGDMYINDGIVSRLSNQSAFIAIQNKIIDQKIKYRLK